MVDAVGLFGEKGLHYELPEDIANDALKAKDNMKSEKNNSVIFSHSKIIMTAILATLMAAPAFSQTKDKTSESKNLTLNTLDFLMKDVNQYFPTEKDYVASLMEQIKDPKLRDFVNECLQETVMKKGYQEPKLTAIILACIEQFCGKEDFANKLAEANDPMIDDIATETLNFDKVVKAKNAQIKAETEELKKQTALLKESIAQGEQWMKQALSTTTVQMIKTDKGIQDAVKTIFDYYVKYNIDLTDHEKALRDALPKGTYIMKGTTNK